MDCKAHAIKIVKLVDEIFQTDLLKNKQKVYAVKNLYSNNILNQSNIVSILNKKLQKVKSF